MLDRHFRLKPDIRLVWTLAVNLGLDHFTGTGYRNRFTVKSLTVLRNADGGVFPTFFLITSRDEPINVNANLRHDIPL
jgi:hypothetical protein